jgi:type VI secretion system secreted protein Hcp
MALSICIQIGKITGESNIKNHVGEIEVLSWNWGLSQSASAHVGSGGGSGTADVQDLTFTKYVDNASPALIQECFQGGDQGEAVLTVLKASGKDALDFVKITMSGTVIVSSVRTGDPLPNDRYSETVTLNFSRVKFEYTLQSGSNTRGATATGELAINQQS